MRLRRTSALAVAAALLFSAACSTTNPGANSTNEGVLNVGMPNGPQTENNNPFLNTSAASSLGYRRLIFEPLAMVNETKPADKPKPWLATEWEWSDNYHKLSLTIRDGALWTLVARRAEHPALPAGAVYLGEADGVPYAAVRGERSLTGTLDPVHRPAVGQVSVRAFSSKPTPGTAQSTTEAGTPPNPRKPRKPPLSLPPSLPQAVSTRARLAAPAIRAVGLNRINSHTFSLGRALSDRTRISSNVCPEFTR